MPPVDERTAHIARAVRIKRNNAITAVIAGTALAGFLAKASSSVQTYGTFVIGLLAGLLYANIFEYVLHRFFLHWGEGFLVKRHALHHDSAGAVDEARYVNFATSPWIVVLVIVLNAPAAIVVEKLVHASVAPGMLVGFTLYYIAYEEIHWRIHFGGWLPRWLRFARRHHMLHHADFKGYYNVFLPICDWLFQRHKWKPPGRDAAPYS